MSGNTTFSGSGKHISHSWKYIFTRENYLLGSGHIFPANGRAHVFAYSSLIEAHINAVKASFPCSGKTFSNIENFDCGKKLPKYIGFLQWKLIFWILQINVNLCRNYSFASSFYFHWINPLCIYFHLFISQKLTVKSWLCKEVAF